MSIFDKQIQFNDCDAGPEPSLRHIIELYYMQAFSNDDSRRLASRLIESLAFELSIENKQDRKDAERYRWLRDKAPSSNVRYPCPYQYDPSSFHPKPVTTGLDFEVDEAMEAQW